MIINVEIDEKELIAQGWIPPAKPKHRRRYGIGEKSYWTIASAGIVQSSREEGSYTNDYAYATGNYYYSKGEAEQALAKQLATQRVIDALEIANNGWVADWHDGKQEKLTIFYDHRQDAFGTDSLWQRQLVQDNNLLGTKEACESVIKSHEADLRIMFGV